MAPPSKISQLPQALRDELNKRIINNGFADYDGLEAWLSEQLQAQDLQVQISRAAIHREGKKLAKIGERVKAMQMMQAGWQRDMGNKGIGELGRVLNAQLQGLVFSLTQDAVDGEVTVDAEFLNDMSATLLRLEKASATNEDRDKKIRDEERKLAQEEAAKQVESLKEDPKLDAATLNFVTEALYGLST